MAGAPGGTGQHRRPLGQRGALALAAVAAAAAGFTGAALTSGPATPPGCTTGPALSVTGTGQAQSMLRGLSVETCLVSRVQHGDAVTYGVRATITNNGPGAVGIQTGPVIVMGGMQFFDSFHETGPGADNRGDSFSRLGTGAGNALTDSFTFHVNAAVVPILNAGNVGFQIEAVDLSRPNAGAARGTFSVPQRPAPPTTGPVRSAYPRHGMAGH